MRNRAGHRQNENNPPVNATDGLGRKNQIVIKSAFTSTALAIGLEAIAMRIGGGRGHRGERAGDKGEQDGENDEALHVAIP